MCVYLDAGWDGALCILVLMLMILFFVDRNVSIELQRETKRARCVFRQTVIMLF